MRQIIRTLVKLRKQLMRQRQLIELSYHRKRLTDLQVT